MASAMHVLSVIIPPRSRLQYHHNHHHYHSLRRNPLRLILSPFLFCILSTTTRTTTTFHRGRSSSCSVEALASGVARAAIVDPNTGGTTSSTSSSRRNQKGYLFGSFFSSSSSVSSTWLATGRMMSSSSLSSTTAAEGMTTTATTTTPESGQDHSHHQQIGHDDPNDNDNVMDRNTKEFHQLAAFAVDLTSVRILSSTNTLSVVRSVRNWDTATRQSYLYRFPLLPPPPSSSSSSIGTDPSILNDLPDPSMQLPPIPLDRSVQIYLPSPSGEKTLVVTTIEKDNGGTGGTSSSSSTVVMEIWKGAALLRRVPIQPDIQSQHGKIIDDPTGFGQPVWSPNEECVLYSAERLPSKKTVPFWATSSSTTSSSSSSKKTINANNNSKDTNGKSSSFIRGGTNVVGDDGQQQEHWGERYSTLSPIRDIYILNTMTGKIGKVTNVPTFYGDTNSNHPSSSSEHNMDNDVTNNGTDSDDNDDGGRAAVTLGQAVWHPNGHRIAYTVWDAGQPKRLGMIFCRNRVSSIYESDVTSLMETLTKVHDDDIQDHDDDVNNSDTSFRRISGGDDTTTVGSLHYARSPRYVVGSSLIFLASDRPFVSHEGCMGLYRWSEEGQVVETVVPMVDHPTVAGGASSSVATVFGMAFPGLFVSQLPSPSEIINDSNTNFIVTTTLWGSVQRIIRINLSNGGVDLIEIPSLRDVSSQSMVCTCGRSGNVIVAEDSNDRPTRLWIIPKDEILQDGEGVGRVVVNRARCVADFPPVAATMFSPILSSSSSSSSSDPTTDILPFDVQIISTIPSPTTDDGVVLQDKNVDDSDPPAPIQSILLLPKRVHDNNDGNSNDGGEGVPLIVIPHGGPHSCSVSSFMAGVAYMANKYAILLPNYRGSTGFGHGPLTSLLTRIGTLDVQDVMACTRHVIETYPNVIDRNRIGICGGSHGGFLTAHCTAQYPDFFRAAAMRNPVTNIASMFGTTDIPDWTMGEVFGTDAPYDPNHFRSPTMEQLMKLHEKSPISKVESVKTPTLIALGMSDLRVPPSQGLEWYHNLRSMKVPTKLLTYPKDGHALDQVATEADHWLHIRDWFDRYL